MNAPPKRDDARRQPGVKGQGTADSADFLSLSRTAQILRRMAVLIGQHAVETVAMVALLAYLLILGVLE